MSKALSWILLTVAALIVLAGAWRADVKFGPQGAEKFVIIAVVFGYIVWRLWRYGRGLFAPRSQFSVTKPTPPRP